ncbi:MAG: hypothetical protein R2795_19585, partial [Saprospiraceae bacterium]
SPAVFANAGPDLTICEGGNTLIGLPQGVSAPLGATYVWTPAIGLVPDNNSQPLASPLVTTTYVMTVSLNSCVRRDTMVVTVDPTYNPVADAGPNWLVCSGTTVTLQGSPTASTPPSNPGDVIIGYYWTPVGDDFNVLNVDVPLTVTPTQNAAYQVFVFSDSGCADTAFVNITIADDIDLSGTSVVEPSCMGGMAGSITLNVTGGTGNYTYDWADLTGTSDPSNRTGLLPGTYSVTVSDDGGCATSQTFNINGVNVPTLNPSGTDVDDACNGTNSGSITVTVSGGVLPYIYNWGDIGVGSSTRTNLAPGVYPITVTDANGCEAITSYTVGEEGAITLNSKRYGC